MSLYVVFFYENYECQFARDKSTQSKSKKYFTYVVLLISPHLSKKKI